MTFEPESSLSEQAAEAFRTSTKAVNDAIKSARQPDMPLDALARMTREAPIASLIAAFLFGYMVARRR